jgi:carbon monoxide dehydrogenase subunit G
MKYSSSVDVPVQSDVVRPFVDDLSAYPSWMPMVHHVVAVSDDVWSVELRAKVGVFARSKALRMRRTMNDENVIVFERDEDDNRQHSPWVMRVSLTPSARGTNITIDLSYGGSLWTAGILDRVLASQVDAGKAGLVRAVEGK